DGAHYARAGWQPEMSPAHEALMEALRAVYRSAGLAAPTEGELPPELARNVDCHAALRLLERRGELTAIQPGRWISTDALHAGIDVARTALAGRDTLGPAEFRDVWGVTRKHLIPLLE